MHHNATVMGVGIGVGVQGSGTPAVLLNANGMVIPIFVSSGQATSIDKAAQDQSMDRPHTHDLFSDVIEALDGTLDTVRIDDLRDGTFLATVEIKVHRTTATETITKDARPSDAIALALRNDTPIAVNEGVIDEAGLAPEQIGDGLGSEEIIEVENMLGSQDPARSEGEQASVDPDSAVKIDIDEPGNEEDEDTDAE